jgi:pimeloyl-ACP methyl ester carboxylesterase
MRASSQQSMSFCCVDFAAIPASVREGIAQSAERIGFEAFEAQQRAIMARNNGLPQLKHIKCPTLVAVGAQDKLTPPECAREIYEQAPNARFQLINGCGHCPPLEQPEPVNKLLECWFEENDSAPKSSKVK